jgi:hypothetical protein
VSRAADLEFYERRRKDDRERREQRQRAEAAKGRTQSHPVAPPVERAITEYNEVEE